MFKGLGTCMFKGKKGITFEVKDDALSSFFSLNISEVDANHIAYMVKKIKKSKRSKQILICSKCNNKNHLKSKYLELKKWKKKGNEKE